MNKCNIVVYNTGHCGNIVKYLLSLHEDTFPLTTPYRSDPFKKITSDHAWDKFELSLYKTPAEWYELFFNQSKYKTITIAEHSYNVVGESHQFTNFDELQYIGIRAGKVFHKYDHKWKHKQNLLVNRIDYPFTPITKSHVEQFDRDYDPYMINIDNFVQGEEKFLAEYRKLLTHLKYHIDNDTINSALSLYRNWYKARGFD